MAELPLRHARRRVGVAVALLRGGRTWVLESGTAGPSPPAADTIFEIDR